MKAVMIFKNLASIIEADEVISCWTIGFKLLAQCSKEGDAISLRMGKNGECSLYFNDEEVKILHIVDTEEVTKTIMNGTD